MAQGLLGMVLSKIGGALAEARATVSEAFNKVSEFVGGLTESAFAPLYRYYERREYLKEIAPSIPSGQLVPLDDILESEFKFKRRYLVNFDVSGTNRFTGEPVTLRWHSYDMERRSKEEYEAVHLEQFKRAWEQYEIDVEALSFAFLEHARGWSY